MQPVSHTETLSISFPPDNDIEVSDDDHNYSSSDTKENYVPDDNGFELHKFSQAEVDDLLEKIYFLYIPYYVSLLLPTLQNSGQLDIFKLPKYPFDFCEISVWHLSYWYFLGPFQSCWPKVTGSADLISLFQNISVIVISKESFPHKR